MALLGLSMAEFMFLLVNLQPAGRKFPSLGVYRSVNGLIGLFLGVSWMPNNLGDPKNVNYRFNSLAMDSPQTHHILNICLTTFDRMATSMVKKLGISVYSTKSGLPHFFLSYSQQAASH